MSQVRSSPASSTTHDLPKQGAPGSPIEGTASGEDGNLRRGRRSAALLALVIAALLVLPAVGAAVWSSTRPSTYAAVVDLLHEPNDTSSADSITRQLATHRVLLLRQPLIDDAATYVGRNADELAESIDIQTVEDSSLLRIQVVDEDPDRARQTAAFLADRYVGIADQLAASSNIGRVRVISPPTMVDQDIGPQPSRAAAGGLLLGLVLTVVFLMLLRQRRRSHHSAP
jgi:uncharacterized protein involved in exopolysaccharide biosynthesis